MFDCTTVSYDIQSDCPCNGSVQPEIQKIFTCGRTMTMVCACISEQYTNSRLLSAVVYNENKSKPFGF